MLRAVCCRCFCRRSANCRRVAPTGSSAVTAAASADTPKAFSRFSIGATFTPAVILSATGAVDSTCGVSGISVISLNIGRLADTPPPLAIPSKRGLCTTAPDVRNAGKILACSSAPLIQIAGVHRSTMFVYVTAINQAVSLGDGFLKSVLCGVGFNALFGVRPRGWSGPVGFAWGGRDRSKTPACGCGHHLAAGNLVDSGLDRGAEGLELLSVELNA